MKDAEKRLEKSIAIVRLAFRDRDFFARLLEEPREALEEKVQEEELELDESDIEHIVKTVRQRKKALTEADAYLMWGRWRDSDDWPMGPPFLNWQTF